ncbi:MAG: BREX-1 system adenine-specific DNA-methyltransferase PglX, partial [Gordonibacter sp.]|uniref:BREX-1 system adenine-specific DNA-methyltransferase PglX n=1 Tax=Gordonibacter sp. TaxID=1968902 RepID=UPI00322014E5
AEITMHSWMFLSSYEKMRKKIIGNYGIVSMAHLGARAFDAISGEVVSTTATVFDNSNSQGEGTYFRLVDGSSEADKAAALREAIQKPDCGWLYHADAESFKSIPGWPIAYWLPNSSIGCFKCLLKDVIQTKIGFVTGDNERFLRLWTEVSLRNTKFDAVSTLDSINSCKKWFPCQKGGAFRRWYGNNDYVVNWWNDGYEAKNDNKTEADRIKSHNYNDEVAFQDGLTYNSITSSLFAVRYVPSGYMFNVAGPLIQSTLDYHLLAGFFNSSVAQMYLGLLNPTINMTPGYLESVPNRLSKANDYLKRCIIRNAESCIEGAKQDWDFSETSWDFIRHPLLPREIGGCVRIADIYNSWSVECRNRFDALKTNEEELNRIFARMYGLEDEVPIEVPDDKVSVRRADFARDIRSLISYAVGCIMGRYSLDRPGLVLANQGDGLKEYLAQVPASTFKPDEDGIIPLTDAEYFHDDGTGLLVDFIRTAYGDDHLEENLQFVADALGGGGTPRQNIRAYFRNGFFADHCKTYSVTGSGKRPIYWLFDSGKKGGFRALFYMHRYTPDLLARLRTEYVHPQQERYRNQLERIDEAMQTADMREQAVLRKKHKKISEQLAETNAYEEKVHHLADQMIEIDLDDGVKHNYALFQDVLAEIK